MTRNSASPVAGAGPLHPPELRELVVRRGLHDDILPVVERHRHPVVRQDLAGDLRHPRKDGADVEHAGNRAQQLDRAFDVRGALALHGGQPRGFRQPLVRQGDGDVVGEALHERQMTGRVRVRAPREQRQHANRDAVDVDGRADARCEAAREARAGTEQPRAATGRAGCSDLPGTAARARRRRCWRTAESANRRPSRAPDSPRRAARCDRPRR